MCRSESVGIAYLQVHKFTVIGWLTQIAVINSLVIDIKTRGDLDLGADVDTNISFHITCQNAEYEVCFMFELIIHHL